jgi:folate-binding protein YgfZ
MGTAQPATIIETPLAQVHRAAGAEIGVWFGSSLPNHFGDWQREFRFAHESVALIDKNYRAYLSFTGPDRVRYLNAILTNNIKDLPHSHGVISLLLNAQGHILAEIETYALAEQLFCVSYAMIRERLIEALEKYIIMDDVTLTDATPRYGTLGFEGPEAARIVRQLTGIDLTQSAELMRQDTQVNHIPTVVTKRSPGEFPGAEFLVERQHLQPLWNLLQQHAGEAGGGSAGYQALNALRLEQGIPWYGYDFGDKQIPNEAALLETHLSFTKGCYTGQEIVERVRSRGHVNRQRVHLLFNESAVPQSGELITDAGNEVGFVTRAALYPPLGVPIGMGYVRRESASVGTELKWKQGSLRVSKFPEELRHT